MSKPKQYANIPVGYVCIPVEEYVDVRSSVDHVFRSNGELRTKNENLEKQIEDLREQLNDAEADRDNSRNAVSYWAGEYNKLKAENDALKAKNESLRETVSFYVPKWEEDEEQCRT